MDVDLVRRRVETKFRVSTSDADALIAALPEEPRAAWVRTVYLDLPDGRLTRAARRDPRTAVKLRIREYDGGDVLWVELKEREGDWSRKRRLPLERERLPELLDGTLDVALIAGPLVPVGEVRYHRTSVERGARLTIDRGISFRAGGRDWEEDGAVVELKHAGESWPGWCEALLGERTPVEYSKFARLCRR